MKLSLGNPRLLPIFITQGFGENKIPFYKDLGLAGHNGLDLIANDGDIIVASHDGIVTFAGEDGSGGLGIVIRTKEQFEDVNGKPSYWKTIYWHLKVGTIMVHASEEVKKGQPIAQADNTGMSTGTHLHFGLKPIYQGEEDWQWMNAEQNNGFNGAVDPKPYLETTVKKHIFEYDLRFGDENEEVRQLQIRLQSLGFFKAKPIGIYGNKTKEAVRGYAMSKLLNITGKIVGPQVRKLLNE